MTTTNQSDTLGILVCTHSVLAESFKQAIEMLMGPQENFKTIGLFEGDDLMNLGKEITEQIKAMKTEKNIIFTDLFGATPSNAAAMSLVDISATVITGVNLPMIAEVLALRNQQSDFEDFIQYIVNKGKESIRVITKEMILKG